MSRSDRIPGGHGRRATVRRANTGEERKLAELGARTFREAYGEHTPAADLEAYIASNYTPDAQAHELAAPDQVVFLAEREGEALGFALLGSDEPAPPSVPGDSPIQLKRIYVVREAWRTGAGSALLTACLDEARSRGADTLWLTTWSENHRALAFYRRHGFVRTGTRPFRLASITYIDPVLARALL